MRKSIKATRKNVGTCKIILAKKVVKTIKKCLKIDIKPQKYVGQEGIYMDNFYDVIVVGTGVAGLYATLNLNRDKKVLLVTKDEVLNCDSYLAQGGICTLLDEKDYKPYFEDTLKAGRFENDLIAVHDMIVQSKEIINDLISKGVNFDKNTDGSLNYTREGGHSTFRILHHKDVTGKEITSKLYDRVKELDNVTIKEFCLVMDIIKDGNSCVGVVLKEKNNLPVAVYCRDVIFATGGLGGLFVNSTNFSHITGDSFAIAIRNGVELKNINYIQIHPTVLYSKSKGRRFLISESVRGEGAKLLNKNGERFINELLPRDVVAGAIMEQMRKDNTKHVWLDFSDISNAEILHHFPNIYNKCLEEGYDVTKEPIPVVPAQHYLMGGIRADICGVTSLKHLYAVGETANNGVHGANRLASNSLLESLTFSKNCARVINYDKSEFKNSTAKIDLKKYSDIQQWQNENKKLVLEEIRKNDEVFYDKWCNIQSKR